MRKLKFGVSIIGNEPVPKIVSQAKLAEELGYHSFWFADSQLLCRELYVSLTACAVATSRIGLGAGVTAPYTRHVSVTAGAFATLAEIAEGRLLLGISNGNSLVRTIGHRPARVAEVEEHVGQLRDLLDNRPVRFECGVENRIAWLERPCRIPIYVAGSGPKLLGAAARVSDGVIYMLGAAPEIQSRALGWIAAGAREAGRDPDRLDVVSWVPASVDADGSLARRHVASHVAGLIGRRALDEFDERDRDAVRRITGRGVQYPHGDTAAAFAEAVPRHLVEMFALAGDAAEVRDQVARMATVDGFDTVVMNLQAPGPGLPSVESVLRTFAAGVMPHFT